MNAIWYRFYSEKDSYEIRFDTTEMSIGDIKKKIIQRRNMLKYPENFDLIFCDEENLMELEDKDLVKPMKHLIIKRFPHYKRENNFVQIVRDPRDISMNKINENGLRRIEPQKIVRYTDPLEKITKKLNKEMINKQFRCKICQKFDEETLFNPVIAKCCKETFCLNCYNKDENKCPNCHNFKVGYVKNDSVANLAEKLLVILAKKEEQEKLLKEAALNQMNLAYAQRANNLLNVNDIGNNQRNPNINDFNPNIDNPNIRFNISGENLVNPNIDPSNLYQLQNQNRGFSLIEGSQYFIIKSSNKENIEKSKKNAVWATTIANSKKLNDAFNKGKVILIFSVNGTQSYQGYAIMTSYSADSPSNLWQIENNIKLGGDFSVVWLCFCELNFGKVKHLQNPKKSGESINKSRDCTELSQNIGYELCKLCYEQEKQELSKNPQQTKIQINQQLIEKINEEIKNNKNKQLKKNNNRINNNNEQNENNTNNTKTNENSNTNTTTINPTSNPTAMPYPIMPMVQPFYMMPAFNPYFRNMAAQYMQVHSQDPNNPNKTVPGILGQPKQDNEPTDINKKDKDKKDRENERRDKDRKKKKDDRGYRHNRDRDRDRGRRRSRSRDKYSRDGSRSRSRIKSRSSRRSSSDSSKSEGRSKYSKSRK